MVKGFIREWLIFEGGEMSGCGGVLRFCQEREEGRALGWARPSSAAVRSRVGQNVSTARRASASRTPQLISSSVSSLGDLSYMTARERRSSCLMDSTLPL